MTSHASDSQSKEQGSKATLEEDSEGENETEVALPHIVGIKTKLETMKAQSIRSGVENKTAQRNKRRSVNGSPLVVFKAPRSAFPRRVSLLTLRLSELNAATEKKGFK